MDQHLAKGLIKNNLLNVNMEIRAAYKINDFSGIPKIIIDDFHIIDILDENKIKFTVQSISDHKIISIFPEYIISIQGMDPKKMIKSYDILDFDDDYNPIKVNRIKPGRKPKKEGCS